MMPFVASLAFAQTPTPEGTVITNTATASWTDANGNTYTPVTASTSVTVGFSAGIDVTGAATGTPASPSAGNVATFPINNIGNGIDSVTAGISIPVGITVTGYRIGASNYATLALLNVALSQIGINAGSSVSVDVIYTVASGRGGQAHNLNFSATSRRSPANPAGADNQTTVLTPSVAANIVTTPDNAASSRLPSNGTQYSETFTVQNNGNATDNVALAASTVGGTLSIVSVNGVAGTSTSVSIASGASQNIIVVYTVGNVAAGTTAPLRLLATSGNNGAISDQGDFVITVVRAAITMTKAAYRDDKTTALTAADRVLPNEYIQYKITVTNPSGVSSSTVSVSDPINAALTYDSYTTDAAGWTINYAAATVTADLSGSLAAGASRFFWVRVKVK